MEPTQADQYVVAPPDVLFLYHTWHRLVSQEFTERKIPLPEFRKFLAYVEEWDPKNWPQAPSEYVQFVKALPNAKTEDLKTLPLSTLPLEVRQAFQGWKNYFLEGNLINEVKATYAEMQEFLAKHPHYTRNYWRNIFDDANTSYLKILTLGTFNLEDQMPSNQFSALLKAAFLNAQQAKKEEGVAADKEPADKEPADKHKTN